MRMVWIRISRIKELAEWNPHHSENSKILQILIQTIYRQVAHPIGFKSIDDIQVSLAPTKIPGNVLSLPGIKVKVNHPPPLLFPEGVRGGLKGWDNRRRGVTVPTDEHDAPPLRLLLKFFQNSVYLFSRYITLFGFGIDSH